MTQIESAVLLETHETSAWSKILHKVAAYIYVDGLKIKRIAIFEQPLSAHIYIKDMTVGPRRQRRFTDAFRSKADPDMYDYVVCLELQERPCFEGTSSYKMERCLYLKDIKTSKRLQFSDRFEHITQLLSNTILKNLTRAGGRNFGVYKLA